MNSSVPDGWSIQPLEKVVKHLIDFRGRTPKKLGMEWGNGNIRALSANNVQMGRVNFDKECYLASDELYEKWMTKGHTEKNDVLFTMEAPLGNVALVPDDNKYILSQRVILMKVNIENITSLFFFQQLRSDQFNRLLTEHSTKSTALGIQQKKLVKLDIVLPPLPEQQKIAQILTSVDEVIEKTQAQIDKLKDLKTAMMQELLTKGIGHVEFKDSPNGMIPVGWEVNTIENLNVAVLDGDRGKEYPKEKDFFQHEHCLFLSAKNVTKKGFRFDVSMFITEKKDNAMRKGKLKRGDIVITTRGTLGNIAYFNEEIPFENVRINSGMAIIRNEKTEVSTEFLNILLHSPLVNEQTELLAFGSAIPQLTIGLLKNLNIPVPCIEEQNKISAMINLVSHKINLIESKLTCLKNTKKALMQDLLTGKVRVNTKQSNSALSVG